MKRPLARALIFAALLLAGCTSTPASRIREKAAIFQTLSPADQAMLREGRIEEGYTAEMVYIALGRPSAVEKSPEGEKWIYRNYYPSEHVSGESLFQQPSNAGNERASLEGVMGKSGPIESSAHGGYVAGTSGLTEASEVPAATMEVSFNAGRVTAYRIQ